MVDKSDLVDLDLDVLTTEYKTIRFNGEAIKVKKPDIKEFIQLYKLGKKMKKVLDAADGKEVSEDQAADMFEELRTKVDEMIPEFRGQNLSVEMLFAIVEVLSQLATPPSAQFLQKAGVEIESTQKKIHQVDSKSSEKSPNSADSTEATPSN